MHNPFYNFLDTLMNNVIEQDKIETETDVDTLLKTNIDWTNPKDVNINYIQKRDEFLPYVLEKVYEEIDENKLRKLMFIYEDYEYLDHAVRKFIDLGRGAGTDKTSWMIEKYK